MSVEAESFGCWERIVMNPLMGEQGQRSSGNQGREGDEKRDSFQRQLGERKISNFLQIYP